MSDESADRIQDQDQPAGDRPPAAARGGDGPERDICIVRPAMFRAHPFKFLLIILMLLGGLALVVLSFIKSPEDARVQPLMLYPGILLALISIIWWTQWWLASTIWTKVCISNKRTIRHEGIIRRHSTEVLHDHVRSVDINQNFLHRILKVGYIGIDSGRPGRHRDRDPRHPLAVRDQGSSSTATARCKARRGPAA